jgi:hypothetical protein
MKTESEKTIPKKTPKNIIQLRDTLLDAYGEILNGTANRKYVVDLSLISCRIMGTARLEQLEKQRMKDPRPVIFLTE